MSILGNRVVRVEDPAFLTSGGTYIGDVDAPALAGAAHVAFARSTVAHARVRSVDVGEARAAPGVVAVVTAAELDLPDRPPPPQPFGPDLPSIEAAMARPLLARDVVRYVGEPVAVVVAETPREAADAAELVEIDYDLLPVVVDPEAALTGETLLFPEAGTNVAISYERDLDAALFDGCEAVVTQRIVNQRLAPVPLEVRGAACAWGEDGRLTYWGATQAPHLWRLLLRLSLDIEEEDVRVIAPDVGGGFGAKVETYAEDVVLAWLARRLDRPLRWVETRSESMVSLVHGRGQVQTVTIGGLRDGTVLAYRLELVQDVGAYPAFGSFLPLLTQLLAAGVYRIPAIETSAVTVVTNTTSTAAYRGAGRPEAAAAIERAMDLFADEIGLDPAELRRRNFIASDAFPYTTPTGATYDIGDYEGALDRVLEASGYAELRDEQRRRREAGDRMLLGIGLSTYVEITAGDAAHGEYARVEVAGDGSATVYTGSSAHGQGHATSWSMILSAELGIPMERIRVVSGDTDAIPQGTGTYGSRSLQVGGVAAQKAALEVVETARTLAGPMLEVDPVDVVFDREAGRFHVAGATGSGVGWSELASSPAAAAAGGLVAATHHVPPGPTFPFGAHVAVVEVDAETGDARLVRFVAVDDAGRILNPLLAEGQVHGGIAQGVAQALFEEVCYDEDGNPLNASLVSYGVVAATELPSFELVEMETPTPVNPLGAKGIGESGTIGSTPAVQNAVVDALSHLGVAHLDMPATPERVWRAIAQARAAP
ncbi:MAG: xanthine dehydrogenase family protein molybdopterin-binding subunit [Gaiellales bacterium]